MRNVPMSGSGVQETWAVLHTSRENCSQVPVSELQRRQLSLVSSPPQRRPLSWVCPRLESGWVGSVQEAHDGRYTSAEKSPVIRTAAEILFVRLRVIIVKLKVPLKVLLKVKVKVKVRTWSGHGQVRSGQVRSDSNSNSNSNVGPELYTKIGFHSPLTTTHHHHL